MTVAIMVAMAKIRPFARDDLPAVAALVDARLPGWRWGESLLVETLFDHPWADPDLPSFVALDERDEVVGFMGAQVRRMRLDDRMVRGVCCSHLVVVADRRAGLAGTLLVQRMLSGPQDLSWTDTATDGVVRMWRGFGGHLDYSRSCDWMLVLKPLRWAGATLRARARRQGLGRWLIPVGAVPIQAAGPRLLPRAFPAPPTDVSAETATVDAIIAHLPALTREVRLRVDYDRAHLDQQFAQVEAAAGPLVRRLVHRGGSPIGWYAYARLPSGVSRVLHLSALESETDAVVGELIEHARADGTTVLAGRAEPYLHRPLRHRFAVLGYARQPVFHTRNPEIRSLLTTSSSLLTVLDGEWFAT
jgi:hypothetical protein